MLKACTGLTVSMTISCASRIASIKVSSLFHVYFINISCIFLHYFMYITSICKLEFTLMEIEIIRFMYIKQPEICFHGNRKY